MYLDDQISQKEKELADLKKQRDSLSPAQRVAEAIHAKECHYSHIDGCSWEYDNWNSTSGPRPRYLKKAMSLLSLADNDEDKVMNFLNTSF